MKSLTINTKQLLITFIPSTLLLALIALSSLNYNISIPMLTQDIVTITKAHPLVGSLSNLGILLWCASAAICFFGSAIIKSNSNGRYSTFLTCSALLSTYLLLDDLFLFHELIAPRSLGIPQTIVIGALVVAVLAYLIAFKSKILQTNYLMLIFALCFLGTSVVIDSLFEGYLKSAFGQWEFFLEDGFKWLGIVCWCSYFTQTTYRLITVDPEPAA